MSVVLSKQLPILASAPGGIKKLRALILELAVRGKLVPQEPNDESASRLVEQIKHEKTRLKGIGNAKSLPQVGEEDQPFRIPPNWRWARLGDLTRGINSGGTPSKSNTSFWNGDIPWASVKDLGFGTPIISTQDNITAAGLDAGSFLARAGSIIICTRMGLGKIGEAKIDVAINQDLKAVQLFEQISKQYFINFFKTLSISGSGMTVAGIKQDELLRFPVPVPPVEEQHRIVAKVDELMALCDRLESEQINAEAAHVTLVANLLSTLTQSNDAADLVANWRRIAEHFESFFTTEASVDALEHSILRLAVMGKLVPQDPKDEPASKLLKRIKQERDELEARSARRISKPMPALCLDKLPFALPDGWLWTTIESIADVGTGTTPLRTNTAYFNPPAIPWVTSGETRNPFISETAEKVSVLALEETNLTVYPAGTLVVAMYGQGKTRGQISELQIDAATNQACASIAPVLKAVELRKYIKLFFEKIYDEIRAEAAGGAQPNLNVGKIKSTLISLPPLAEQQRIVAKVDELKALCRDLRTALGESRRQQELLASTLIESSLNAA